MCSALSPEQLEMWGTGALSVSHAHKPTHTVSPQNFMRPQPNLVSLAFKTPTALFAGSDSSRDSHLGKPPKFHPEGVTHTPFQNGQRGAGQTERAPSSFPRATSRNKAPDLLRGDRNEQDGGRRADSSTPPAKSGTTRSLHSGGTQVPTQSHPPNGPLRHSPARWFLGVPTMWLLTGWLRASLISMVKRVFMASLAFAPPWAWGGRGVQEEALGRVLDSSTPTELPLAFSTGCRAGVNLPSCHWLPWLRPPGAPASLGPAGPCAGGLAVPALEGMAVSFAACSVPALEVPNRRVLSENARPWAAVGKSAPRWECRSCCCCCKMRAPLLGPSPLGGVGAAPAWGAAGSALNLRARSSTEPDLWKGCSRRGSRRRRERRCSCWPGNTEPRQPQLGTLPSPWRGCSGWRGKGPLLPFLPSRCSANLPPPTL